MSSSDRTSVLPALFFLVLGAAAGHAQEDLVAVSFDGRLHRLDVQDGTLTTTGDILRDGGLAGGTNDIAVDPAGHLYVWSSNRLLRFGPQGGEAVLLTESLGPLDVRGMAFADDGTLFFARDGGSAGGGFFLPDQLQRVDVGEQTTALIAELGYSALQSLAFRDGRLYSYEHGTPYEGLVTIDPFDGTSVDLPAPGLTTPAPVQCLAFDAGGRLFGGQARLFEFAPQTGGILSDIGVNFVGFFPDLRGFDFVSTTRVVLDFETEDDMTTPLVNGQAIDPFGEFGNLVTIQGSGPNLGAAIFDSTPGGPNDPSQDPDLLVGLGNVLILQNDQAPASTVPGVFDRPNDDSQGGTLSFQFAQPVRPLGIDLIDIDTTGGYALVTLFDSSGNVRVHDMAPGWSTDLVTGGIPGFRTLYLQTTAVQRGFAASAGVTQYPAFDQGDVVRIEVRLNGSGAVDNLCFEPGSPRGRTLPRGLTGPRPAPTPRSSGL